MDKDINSAIDIDIDVDITGLFCVTHVSMPEAVLSFDCRVFGYSLENDAQCLRL